MNISHIGDILAIPLFFLTATYFYKIKNKTPIEYVLLTFSICGFILDISFTVMFLKKYYLNI